MLPAAASLRKQGANKGATTAFLISTPESGVDSIAVTYALLDPLMTVVRPVAAFVTALSAGVVENVFFWNTSNEELKENRLCPVDGCCDGTDCPDEVHNNHHTLREKIVAGIRFSYGEVWGDIAVWFFIGVILAGTITAFIPDEFMATFFGGGLGSMVIMLVAGIPLYICATASTPVAAALILKGVSPGAALVFLLVGPATNLASISVLIGLLGKRSTALYLAILSFCAVAFGLGVDSLYSMLGISPLAVLGEASELIPGAVKVASVAVVFAISVKPVYQFMKKTMMPSCKKNMYVSDFPVIKSVLNQPVKDPVKERSSCDCCK